MGSYFPDIGKTIRKFSPLLAEDEECRQLFPKGSFRMAYKRGHNNLKEIVAPSRILMQDNQLGRNSRVGQHRKCNKCGENPKGHKRANGLNNCTVLEKGSVFYSKSTGERYTIRQNTDCRNKNVIYLVNCKKCRMQGVGKSEDYKTRISNYISHIIQSKATCGIVKHFIEMEGHSGEHFGMMGIVQIENPPGTKSKLKKMLADFEGYWQIKLQTMKSWAMNLKDEFFNMNYGDMAGRSYLAS